MDAKAKSEHVFQSLGTLTKDDRAAAAVQLLADLKPEAQTDVLQRSGIESPSQATANFLWKITVSTIAALLLLTAATIVYAVVFRGKSANDVQIILTLFTSTITFLTGLFIPSPTQTKK